MSIRPKQLSRIGEFHLEEAVMDVLCHSHPTPLGAADIGRRAGIHRDAGVAGMNDAIVHGILNKLATQKRVERVERVDPSKRGGGWRLSVHEYGKRREDIRDD